MLKLFLIWSAIEDSSFSSIILQDNIYLKNEKQERRRESNHQNQPSVWRFYCAVVRVKGLDRRTARPGSVQQLAGSSYLAAASLTRAPTAAGVKKRQNLQHPENYNRNTIPKHKRQMFDRRSIVAHWYPRAVPLRSWATFLDVAHFNIISQALAMSTPSAAPTMTFLFCVFLLLIIEIYTDDWGGAGSEGAYEHLKGHLNPFII